MKILAVDTATNTCSVALADAEGTIAELSFMRGRTHSRHLADMVAALLQLAAVKLEAVDAFAVDTGPGTFTGLRIGLALIKGLAAATGKPVVGVSSLDALSQQAAIKAGSVCAMLDARRGEVYTALYAVKNQKLKKISSERAMAPREALETITGDCLFIGNGAAAYHDLIWESTAQTARFAEPEASYLRAATVARMGLAKLQVDHYAPADRLVPNYIRRPDAQKSKNLSVGDTGLAGNK